MFSTLNEVREYCANNKIKMIDLNDRYQWSLAACNDSV